MNTSLIIFFHARSPVFPQPLPQCHGMRVSIVHTVAMLINRTRGHAGSTPGVAKYCVLVYIATHDTCTFHNIHIVFGTIDRRTLYRTRFIYGSDFFKFGVLVIKTLSMRCVPNVSLQSIHLGNVLLL